eukprot:g2983.t1
MLRSLSHAALEHSRAVSSLQRSTTLLDLAYESEEDTDARTDYQPAWTCLRRVGLCIGYLVPSWGHLSLANVGRSWAAGFCALWHCYLFATSATLLFVNSAATILQCYIQWFSTTSVHLTSFQELEFKTQNSIHFIGAFFRSYILLSVTSDVMRFAYLLCKDAWRADVFEAYRRLWACDAWNEVSAGEFYSHNWSMCLSRRQKICDVICQCFLHASIDLVPFLLFLYGINEKETTQVFLCRICLCIGIVHILVFYFLWLCTDVALKLHHFVGAWAMARGHSPARHRTYSYHPTAPGVPYSECRSLYALCAALVHGFLKVLPVAMAIATLIFGLLVSPNCYAVAAGMALSSIMLTLQILGPVDTITMGNMRLLDPWFPIPEELQQWAEQWCDLGFSEQKQKQQPFLLMLGFSALAFGFFGFPGLTMVCILLLVCVLLELLVLRAAGRLSWLWCFLESAVETLILIYIMLSTASDALADCTVNLPLFVLVVLVVFLGGILQKDRD